MAKDKDKAEKRTSPFLNRSDARKLHAKLNEMYGAGAVGIASQVRRFKLDRYSTQSLALDFALGGGIPAERITELVGKGSSGKTTLALRIVADAQKRCANCLRYVPDLAVEEIVDPETGEVDFRAVGHCDCYATGLFLPRQADGEKDGACEDRLAAYTENSFEESRVVYVDAENALDMEWARAVGVDLRRLVHVKPDRAEQAIDMYADYLYSGIVDLIVLDSIAALTPTKEIEESASDAQQGEAPRLVNKWVRRVGSGGVSVELGGGRNRAPTQIWINQLRQKIGVTFGEGLVKPGGMGQTFASSAEVKLWTTGWEKKKLLDTLPKDERIDVGERVDNCWVVEKNKTGPAKGEGRFTMFVSGPRKGQVDEFGFIAHLAERYGILRDGEKKGTWQLGNEAFKTKSAAFERMREPAVLAALRSKLMQRMEQERDA